MKAIVLAAGYATRLYPLTKTCPKPLLEVAGKPMLERVLDSIVSIQGIERALVVINAKFAQAFESWGSDYRRRKPGLVFKFINDGSTDDSNKLGAIGDLLLVLNREQIDDDIIVVAGDNLFSESLEDFGRFCTRQNAPVVALYDVGSLAEITKYNSITRDSKGQITFFKEKPTAPESTLTAIALYYYPRASLPLIRQYVAEGNNPDQPGRLVEWFYQRTPFYTWKLNGFWFDIGSKVSLETAGAAFAMVAQSSSNDR